MILPARVHLQMAPYLKCAGGRFGTQNKLKEK